MSEHKTRLKRESRKFLQDNKADYNRDLRNLVQALERFESFSNETSFLDLLPAYRIIELAMATQTQTKPAAVFKLESSALMLTLLEPTTPTKSTLGQLRAAKQAEALLPAITVEAPGIMSKMQQLQCESSTVATTADAHANFPKHLLYDASFTAPSLASTCSSNKTAVSSNHETSSTAATTAELLRCNMAKIATNFLTAIITTTTSGRINCSNNKNAQQIQKRQQQFVSFNSREPKRKVRHEQPQQREHPRQRRHYYQRRRSSSDCFLAAGIFSWIFLMVLNLQIVSASSGLLNKNEPIFISRSETFKFVSGETILLPCEVANTEPYIVAWKRGIAILFAGSVKVSPDPRLRLVNGFNLQIRDAVPQDAGDYICQIATMEPREITHTVEILVPPRIHHISSGGHLQVKKGSSVRIECAATGNPTPNVTWSRKNNILPNGDEKLHSHVLSIENVDRHKGGVYICTANNGVGQPASNQVVLHVLYPPEISVERPVVFSGEGHEAMLVCIVHGETQPEVIWFKDTMQLDTTERHIMETRGSRHTLIIRKVHPQDFGNYSCVAENQLGKSRKTLQLSGKPNVAVFNSPPISQYKDRYNISWTVDSHTPIEEYKLSYRRIPQGHEVDNSIDHSSSSPSSSSNLQQMYGGVSNHNHRINVGVVYNSNVQYWDRNDWRDVVLPAIPLSHHYTQGLSYMIRGLDPDQQYEATVQARNRYGWSDLTHSFVFSTSSNDNEMRDLSVTFYGSVAVKHSTGFKELIGVLIIFVTITFVG